MALLVAGNAGSFICRAPHFSTVRAVAIGGGGGVSGSDETVILLAKI